MIAGRGIKNVEGKQAQLRTNINKLFSRRGVIQLATCWLLLLAGNLPAWGASGNITIESPALTSSDGIFETASDFTVFGNYILDSDDTPTGNSTTCPVDTPADFKGFAQLIPYADDCVEGIRMHRSLVRSMADPFREQLLHGL